MLAFTRLELLPGSGPLKTLVHAQIGSANGEGAVTLTVELQLSDAREMTVNQLQHAVLTCLRSLPEPD